MSDEKSNTEEADLHDNLFHSADGLIDFTVIEVEIQQLAEFGNEMLEFVNARVDTLQNDLRQYDAEPNRSFGVDADNPDLEVTGSDFAMGIENVSLPQWENTRTFMAPAMLLLSL